MKIDEIVALSKAGFTAEQIAQMSAAQATPPPQPIPQPTPPPQPTETGDSTALNRSRS